jgi:hypothetical protein
MPQNIPNPKIQGRVSMRLFKALYLLISWVVLIILIVVNMHFGLEGHHTFNIVSACICALALGIITTVLA